MQTQACQGALRRRFAAADTVDYTAAERRERAQDNNRGTDVTFVARQGGSALGRAFSSAAASEQSENQSQFAGSIVAAEIRPVKSPFVCHETRGREHRLARLHPMSGGLTKTTMRPQRTLSALDCAGDDATLVARLARHDQDAFEMLMRRYNGRLFRIARAILKDDAEAEDALQDAYLDAYRHIGDFRGGARFGTWLTRITINQALMRLRKQKRDRVVVPFADRHATESEPAEVDVADERTESPPRATLRAEIRAILERRIDELPVAFRTVFVMRDVEDMSVEQAAECLSIPAATVRTRLFRARALLRAALARDIDRATLDVFTFAGERCDRIVAGVLARVRAAAPATHPSDPSPDSHSGPAA